jgi:tRNA-dihydrouridine synthase 1
MAESTTAAKADAIVTNGSVRTKLHGRDFYESVGSPKVILAPMVDQSEFVRCVSDLAKILLD